MCWKNDPVSDWKAVRWGEGCERRLVGRAFWIRGTEHAFCQMGNRRWGHRECPSPVRACVAAGRGRLGVCRRSPGRRAGQPGWEGRDAPEKAAEAGGTLTTSQLSDDFLSVPLLPSE